jgi:hypothetical protein
MSFSKLHFEHPGEDLGFLSAAETLILRTLPNAKFLQGGIQDFGKTLGVQAVAANPNSRHPWWVVDGDYKEGLSDMLLKGKELGELGCTE